jgi:AAA+ ATPase superfamily predicted ATPase
MEHKYSNPFTFGDLALDEAFTDREAELRELTSDMRNGQNVLVYAPRRYGKSSLVIRAAQEVQRRRVLVGYCDLMRTPTKERFAAALAKTIYADIASPVGQAIERAANLFRGLRVTPTMEVDPVDGSLRFTFQPGRRRADIDDTIERLLELPAELAVERKRRAVLVFDEFQEILTLDKRFPNLMRAVFQAQPEVGHVYLGSKRHLVEKIFNDRNEPFWRSAKRLELGPIPPAKFAGFIRSRFEQGARRITDDALRLVLGATGGQPYATQELAYFLWELVPQGGEATDAVAAHALEDAIRSESNHLWGLWDGAAPQQRSVMLALAEEPTRSIYSTAYQERHDLPRTPSLQTALNALTSREVVGRDPATGEYVLIEPFLGEWLRRGERR